MMCANQRTKRNPLKRPGSFRDRNDFIWDGVLGLCTFNISKKLSPVIIVCWRIPDGPSLFECSFVTQLINKKRVMTSAVPNPFYTTRSREKRPSPWWHCRQPKRVFKHNRLRGIFDSISKTPSSTTYCKSHSPFAFVLKSPLILCRQSEDTIFSALDASTPMSASASSDFRLPLR